MPFTEQQYIETIRERWRKVRFGGHRLQFENLDLKLEVKRLKIENKLLWDHIPINVSEAVENVIKCRLKEKLDAISP